MNTAMIKIITTVGTSLLSNYSKDKFKEFKNECFHPDLFDHSNNNSNTKNGVSSDIEKTEKVLLEHVKKKGGSACAELSSIQKIDPKGKAEIYLLCTETVTSYMCGRVLEKYLTEEERRNTILEYIPNLQVTNAKEFQDKGFLNLIASVKQICDAGKDHTIYFNISGGYKALIPAMTLLAQLEHVSLCYLFEESDELIEIGNLPMSFDWEVIEEFVVFLHHDNKRNSLEDENMILSEMRDLKLIKRDSRELTFVGQLLREYSKNASPFTKTIFGYFIEHKIYECYVSEYRSDKVEHSVKLPKGSGVQGDIDLLITPAKGQFIPVEIKESYYLEKEEEIKKIQKNLIERTNAIKGERGTPVEVWLLVYSYAEAENATTQDRKPSEHEQNLLNELGAELKAQIAKDLIFRVKHFYIKKNKLGGERHVYQRFMKETLKTKTITDLFVFK